MFQVLKVLKKKSPDLKILKVDWLQDCIDYHKLLEVASYSLLDA